MALVEERTVTTVMIPPIIALLATTDDLWIPKNKKRQTCGKTLFLKKALEEFCQIWCQPRGFLGGRQSESPVSPARQNGRTCRDVTAGGEGRATACHPRIISSAWGM